MPAIASISQQIWDSKYRLRGPGGEPVDKTVDDTLARVARAIARVEADPAAWEARFRSALADFRFLPAGRIIAGAGADSRRNVTLFNCFVMGTIPDDMAGIFTHLREAAVTMQQGGGIGYDFSTLRPKGAPVRGVGADASGPLSFMDVWDAMCRTIMSAGSRRGAMMATLACDHPDIEAFIEAKSEPGRLRMFNLSVLVTDAFMQAVKDDQAWELSFGGTIYKSLPARSLWEKIMRATYAYAEPGVIFIDRINRLNNLAYCETIRATNPCGEQPLPPYGACLLGAVNLAQLVENPFADDARIDATALADLVAVAVRMLDNVIDLSKYPLPEQAAEAKAKRRIGLGITGLADALIMCRVRYGSDEALRLTAEWMNCIRTAAYRASALIAAEKGPFPLFDAEHYLAGETVAGLDEETRALIRRHGVRNALLTTVAPTGTTSLLADNVSSGIEPVFSYTYIRRVLSQDGSRREEEVSDYAYRLFRRIKGENLPLPDYFVDTRNLAPRDHVRMQATVQRYVDASISKTINVPEDITFEAFKDVYLLAYDEGCKGLTTYRPNDISGSVLEASSDGKKAAVQGELPLPAPGTATRSRDEFEAGGIVYMTQPLSRPEELPGHTYKVRWPDSDHAIYITINDVIQDGRRRPFEIFINSKNMEHYAWTVALTRMISAVFRRGGDVSFVVEELKAVFDPRGGQWMNGRYVPSLLAAIGEAIERHMIDIGFLSGRVRIGGEPEPSVMPTPLKLAAGGRNVIADEPAAPSLRTGQRSCPKCGMPSLIRAEGCDTCTSCGYSKCS